MRLYSRFGLYVITTEQPGEKGRGHFEVAQAAVDGGAEAIQLRDKKKNRDELLSLAKQIAKMTKNKGVLFIVNDYPDIAVKAGADGVHLGQADIKPSIARQIMPYSMIIGVSATNYEEAVKAAADGADYIGVGPIYPTPSKDDAAPPMGLKSLEKVRQGVNIPLIAIGGITEENVKDVIRAGADGVAVISTVAGAANMRQAVAGLVKKINQEKLLKKSCPR